MKFNKLLLTISFFYILAGCATNNIKNIEKNYHESSGFALIYDEKLYHEKIINKKINNENIIAMHNAIKINTRIKITNPFNNKTIETKIHKRANYPSIFNIVISKEIANILELSKENPFVEINEIKKNKTFIAKEGNTFEEEKNVADKAPVDEIKMNEITETKKISEKKLDKKSSFILVISDFYYLESANNLKNELIKKIKIKNISIKKINNNKYRLLVGPFENFNALKTTYISLNNLGFENLNIYKK